MYVLTSHVPTTLTSRPLDNAPPGRYRPLLRLGTILTTNTQYSCLIPVLVGDFDPFPPARTLTGRARTRAPCQGC